MTSSIADTSERADPGRRRDHSGASSRTLRIARQSVLLIVVMALGSVAGWSCRALLSSPAANKERPYTLTTARKGTLEKTVTLPVNIRWPVAQKVFIPATGTVTKISTQENDFTDSGRPLMHVDGMPIFGVQGMTPAYRPLSLGDSGDDVQQLKAYLRGAGYLKGSNGASFDRSTVNAYNAWQKDAGSPRRDSVTLGSTVFIQELPARIKFSQDLAVGQPLEGATRLVEVLGSTPDFELVIPESHQTLVQAGQKVSIPAPDGQATWTATVKQVGAPKESSMSTATLGPSEGESVCSEQCGDIPTAGLSALASTLEVEPPVQGVIIPSEALIVKPDGRGTVTLDTGEQTDVDVLAEFGGRAAVKGINDGTRVRIEQLD